MSTALLVAGILTILLGLVHSIVGHKLVFVGEADTLASLPARKRGIIWASWHLATLLAIGLAAMLIWLSQSPALVSEARIALYVLAACLFAGAALVHIGTKGKHPGWIVLAIIATLIAFAAFH